MILLYTEQQVYREYTKPKKGDRENFKLWKIAQYWHSSQTLQDVFPLSATKHRLQQYPVYKLLLIATKTAKKCPYLLCRTFTHSYT